MTKRVVFKPPEHKEIVFVGNGVVPPPYLISAMKACKLIRKGCQGYLYYVLSEQTVNVELNGIPIVREFAEISFNVYVWHVAGLIIVIILNKIFSLNMKLNSYKTMILFRIILYVFGSISYYVIEKGFGKLILKNFKLDKI